VLELDPRVTPEQQIYARWLDLGTRISLVALAATLLAYTLDLFSPWVPLVELPAVWSLPVDRYLALTASPAGWVWLRLLNHGDYLNLAGIALLGLVTVACYLRLVPALLARGERLQAAVAIAQILVLLAAASGIFAGGH
jgi:hypothetical protein